MNGFRIAVSFATVICLMSRSSFGAETDGQDSNKPASGFFRAPVLSMIHYYQTRISPNSIQRCPFEISCSHFAEEAVERYGVTGGLIRTIDRYYYRENKQAFALYARVEGGEGRLLLDDGLFLASEEVPVQQAGDSTTSEQPDDIAIDVAYGMNEWDLRDWAIQVYRDGQYFEARLLFLRLETVAFGAKEKRFAVLMQAKCLLREHCNFDAVITASSVIADSTAPLVETAQANKIVAEAYLQQRIFPLAETHFRKAIPDDTTGIPEIGLGMIALEAGNWGKSDSIRKGIKAERSGGGEFSEKWGKCVEQGRKLPLRSKLLAASMSAVVPGSGQFYCKHQVDGMQAFTFVAGFAYATYMAYRYESTFHKARIGTVIGGSLTLAFYTANIWGARQTAIYRNMKMRDDVCAPMRVRFGELME